MNGKASRSTLVLLVVSQLTKASYFILQSMNTHYKDIVYSARRNMVKGWR